jgi:O-antigen/teichoic acid export membrane protein
LILAILSFGIFGAMLSLLLGILASFILITISLKSYIKLKQIKSPKLLPFFKYSSAVFVQGLALTSMYSSDLLLVKHFFPPDQAGIYASMAILGRVVFFGTTPITHVMFPLVAKRHQNNQRYLSILYLSLILIFGISLFVILTYRFFPNLIIQVTFRENFIAGANMLWWFALFMGLLSLAMFLTQFYLSIGKTKIVWLFVLAALLQLSLIWFIHPDLLTVIQLSILSVALLVMALFVYFLYHR